MPWGSWIGLFISLKKSWQNPTRANKAWCLGEAWLLHLRVRNYQCSPYRLLVFLAGKHNFWFIAVHIPGKRNVVADALSRNNILLFHSQAPDTDSQPAQLSTALVSLVSQIYNMDIHQLDQVVQRLYRAGLSSASHKTYQVAQRRYWHSAPTLHLHHCQYQKTWFVTL